MNADTNTNADADTNNAAAPIADAAPIVKHATPRRRLTATPPRADATPTPRADKRRAKLAADAAAKLAADIVAKAAAAPTAETNNGRQPAFVRSRGGVSEKMAKSRRAALRSAFGGAGSWQPKLDAATAVDKLNGNTACVDLMYAISEAKLAAKRGELRAALAVALAVTPKAKAPRAAKPRRAVADASAS